MKGLMLLCLWGVVDRVEGDWLVVEWAVLPDPSLPEMSDVAFSEINADVRESDRLEVCLWTSREGALDAVRSLFVRGRRPEIFPAGGIKPDRCERSITAPGGAFKEGVSCTR